MAEKDGAFIADSKIAAGVDPNLNQHPLNCDIFGTLNVNANLSGQSTPIDVIVNNVVPVSQNGIWIANTLTNLTAVSGISLTLGQKTSTYSIPVVIALDQSAIPVSVVPSATTYFQYITGSLSAIGSVIGTGICNSLRVFANGVDSSFTINTGQIIVVRSNQIFQITPKGTLLNPVIDWVSGSIDVWMEVDSSVMPLPADLGLSLGIAHLGH